MDFQALVGLLRQQLPKLMAVYTFGSRAGALGHPVHAESDLDLAVLVEGYADPIELFELAGLIADQVVCPVDLLDLRAASTVMQHQILTTGKRLWARDVAAGLFEAAMLSEKLYLDEARRPLIQDVMRKGIVYGR